MYFLQKLDSHFSEAHPVLTLEMQAVRSSCWDLPPAASACAPGAAPAFILPLVLHGLQVYMPCMSWPAGLSPLSVIQQPVGRAACSWGAAVG